MMTATIEAISVLALKPPDHGFPASKLKLAVILVTQSNTQVTMKLHACATGGYEVTFPLLWPGYKTNEKPNCIQDKDYL